MKKDSVIYLNEAATAWPLAPGVTEAMLSALSIPATTAGRGEDSISNNCDLCRKSIAKSINVDDYKQIILTQNATHSINIAISGLDSGFFKKVVTTVFEHNSVLRPLRYRVNKEGGELIIIGLNDEGEIDMNAMLKALNTGVTMLAVNHASNVTGDILPVSEIFKTAKNNGAITLLDAAQTWGVIPVNPLTLSADIIALTGHKGMRGPTGTGALYINKNIDIQPVFSGGTGIWSEEEYQPREMPVRLEIGTPNEHGFAGLNAAIDWNLNNDITLKNYTMLLFQKLISGLQDIPGVILHGSNKADNRLPIVSFTIENHDTDEIGFILEHSFNIKCRTGLHCAPLINKSLNTFPKGTIRLSLSGFNTDSEIDFTLSAIRKIIKCV